jgi:hypothetical protein
MNTFYRDSILRRSIGDGAKLAVRSVVGDDLDGVDAEPASIRGLPEMDATEAERNGRRVRLF